MQSLQEKYKKEVLPELKKQFELKNSLECPRPEKIVVNVGVGNWVTKDPGKKDDVLKKISGDLMLITGQKPQVRPARKSISGFRLREGMPAGLRVTLRGKRMYQFLEKLIHVVFPRIRDFQGIKLSSVDKNGNLTVGVDEQLIFPEISADETNFFFGMEITVVTSAEKREEGLELLRKLGVPFAVTDNK